MVINGYSTEEAIEKVTAVPVLARSETASATGESIDADEQTKGSGAYKEEERLIHELKEYVEELKESNLEKDRRIAEMEVV
jgi:PAB1-binding protein PBP1